MREPSSEAGQSWPTPEPCERLTSSVSQHMWANTIHTTHNCVRMHFEQRGVCADEAGAGRHHNMPSHERMKDHQPHGKGTRTNCHRWPSLPLFLLVPLVKCVFISFGRNRRRLRVLDTVKKKKKKKVWQNSLKWKPHLINFSLQSSPTCCVFTEAHIKQQRWADSIYLKRRMNQVGKGDGGWPGTNEAVIFFCSAHFFVLLFVIFFAWGDWCVLYACCS